MACLSEYCGDFCDVLCSVSELIQSQGESHVRRGGGGGGRGGPTQGGKWEEGGGGGANVVSHLGTWVGGRGGGKVESIFGCPKHKQVTNRVFANAPQYMTR